MTNLTLKNASIVSQSGGDGMYEITLTCRLKDVSGEIVEVTGLDVEIKANTRNESNRRGTTAY